jgi:hypothetical protein
MRKIFYLTSLSESKLFFTLCLVLYLVAHIFLYSYDISIHINEFQFISWDEFQYLSHIKDLQATLKKLDFVQFLSIQEPFGYSDLFFLFFSAISFPFHQLLLDGSGLYLFYIRCINLIFLASSFLIARLIIKKISKNNYTNLFLLFVYPLPGLFLLYKPFSPTYMGLFFLVCALYFYLQKKITISFLFLGLAIAIKIFLAFFLVLFLIDLKLFKNFFFHLKYIAIVLTAFLLSNPSIFKSIGSIKMKYIGLHRVMDNLNYPHAIKPDGIFFRLINWLDNESYNRSLNKFIGINTTGFFNEFICFSVTILLIITCAYVIYKLFPNNLCKLEKIIFPFCVFGLWLFMLTFNRVWTWYLFELIFILGISLPVVAQFEGKNFFLALFFMIFINGIYQSFNLYIKVNEFRQCRINNQSRIMFSDYPPPLLGCLRNNRT